MIPNPNVFALLIVATPIALMAMTRLGAISTDVLVRNRRYAFFGSFTLAAIFTPPDALSQVIAALALIGLYEISIWCTRRAT
jgi:sec-independent protein translocase protein TatC